MPQPRPTGTDNAKLTTLIETQSKRGFGTREDPHRIVREYWTLDGTKMAEYDPVNETISTSSSPQEGEQCHTV